MAGASALALHEGEKGPRSGGFRTLSGAARGAHSPTDTVPAAGPVCHPLGHPNGAGGAPGSGAGVSGGCEDGARAPPLPAGSQQQMLCFQLMPRPRRRCWNPGTCTFLPHDRPQTQTCFCPSPRRGFPSGLRAEADGLRGHGLAAPPGHIFPLPGAGAGTVASPRVGCTGAPVILGAPLFLQGARRSMGRSVRARDVPGWGLTAVPP